MSSKSVPGRFPEAFGILVIKNTLKFSDVKVQINPTIFTYELETRSPVIQSAPTTL